MTQKNPGYGHNSRATKPPVEERDTRPGAALVIFRKYFGYSQQKIAQHLGVSFQQIQKYENGKNRMSAPKIEKAAELFGLSITAFFREFDPETQDLEITIQTLKQEYIRL